MRIIILTTLIFQLTAFAKVRMVWNENKEEDLAGYRVYWGLFPQNYTWSKDVGTQTYCEFDSLDENKRYYAAVTALDYWGNESPYSQQVVFTLGEGPALPESYKLSEAYPNPFTLETYINYSLPETAFIEIAVYNIVGQKIRELERGTFKAGLRRTRWDGYDHNGNRAAAGTYFCRIKFQNKVITRKMTLVY